MNSGLLLKKKHFRALGCQPEEEIWVMAKLCKHEHRLILSAHIGDMTQKSANKVVKTNMRQNK